VKVTQHGDPIENWAASIRDTAGPPHRVVKDLELMLASAFEVTQAATHVITGSLKASGKTESDFDGDEWTGAITYGGALWSTPAPGPAKDPVVYAIYEMARGGDHDFFGPLVAYEGKVEDIINKHFKG
jgi:hypothetical protein